MQEISILSGDHELKGHFSYILNCRGWIIFAHGSGSSRLSTRNNWVASELNKHGYSTLLFDLLTVEEDSDSMNRFDINLLAKRLLSATKWLLDSSDYFTQTPIAYFGASTGAAAALVALAHAPLSWPIEAVISRGGRPDLAGEHLARVKVPTLLIVGGLDYEVKTLNIEAARKLKVVKVESVAGATHLFEEAGALQEVVHLSLKFLERHLTKEHPNSLIS